MANKLIYATFFVCLSLYVVACNAKNVKENISHNEKKIYKLIESDDNKLCEKITSRLNKNIDKDRKSVGNLLANKIQDNWKHSYYYLVVDGETHKRDISYVIFDINNDGKEDFLVKEKIGIYGKIGEQILVLNETQFNQVFEKNISMSEYYSYPGILLTTEFPYKVNINNVAHGDSRYYKENNNISMSNLYLLNMDKKYLIFDQAYRYANKPKWLVVATVLSADFLLNEKYSGIERKYFHIKQQCLFEELER